MIKTQIKRRYYWEYWWRLWPYIISSPLQNKWEEKIYESTISCSYGTCQRQPWSRVCSNWSIGILLWLSLEKEAVKRTNVTCREFIKITSHTCLRLLFQPKNTKHAANEVPTELVMWMVKRIQFTFLQVWCCVILLASSWHFRTLPCIYSVLFCVRKYS